uniref:Uncharacterized protein LOC111113146 n=1 Tax=Crassostrea virginica TaxID=6565 RepID=A0A8B8BU21_CRAVI|nr:uncharacterized protein LOC111113146 [Crassostrea virginica]
MRSCRMNMVQTYEQYKTIYLALNEEFKGSVDTKSVSAFKESIKHLFEEDPSVQVIFQKEFKTLSHIKPASTESDFRDGTFDTENTEEKEALQLNENNLYLTPTVSNCGKFINATFVSSPTWLQFPSQCSMFGPFRLHHESDSEVDVKVTNVKILDGKGLAHPVKIVQPTGPLKSVQDTACLRNLVSYVMHIQRENPITIVSKDGTSLGGVFCAVFNCIQQINMDDSVDVFTTVRQLQTRRPEFCSTLDEYILVYKSVKDFIEFTSEHVYSNQ